MSLRQTKEFTDKPLKVAAVGQNKSSIDGKLTQNDCLSEADVDIHNHINSCLSFISQVTL